MVEEVVPMGDQGGVPKRGLSKALLAVSIGAGLALIGAGGASAYYYAKVKPERVIRQALITVFETKTVEYEGAIAAEAVLPKQTDFVPTPGLGGALPDTDLRSGGGKVILNLTFQNRADFTDPAKQRSSFAVAAVAENLPGLLPGQQEAGFEARTLDDVVYFKFSKLPNTGFFDLSSFAEQWIKVDVAAILSKVGIENPKEALDQAQKRQRPTPTEIAELKAAVQRAELIVIDGVTSEKIDGASLYRYDYHVDKAGLVAFLGEAARILRVDQEFETEMSKITEGLQKVEAPYGSIWIRKKEMTPFKVTVAVVPLPGAMPDAAQGKVSAQVVFKSFNQPVQIEAPTSSKTIEEVVAGIFQGLMGADLTGVSTSSMELGDTDKDGLMDELEVNTYGTNPYVADTDGDGFKDGDEVKNGYNPNGPGKLPKTTTPVLKKK